MAAQFASSSSSSSSSAVRGSWSGGSVTWDGANQFHEEAFIRDFDSTSPEANLRAIRSIRNFITANPVNKRILVQNNLIKGRIMSLIASFSTNIEYSSVFKRDFLCMYASFLRESPAFAEEMCSQKAFLNDLLNAASLNCESTTDPSLREAILIFVKTLFEADTLDQDLESVSTFKKTVALEIFTKDRLTDLIHLSETLFETLRRGSKESATALVYLTKLLALLTTNATLAERGGEPLFRFAHRGVMATICPRHALLMNQDRGLILPFDVAEVAPCPDATAHAIARFSLKILFFAIYHVPVAFGTFKTVISVTDPLSLISVYSHLSQPYSRCYLGHRSNTTIGSPFSTYRRHRCVTRSDPLIYHPDEDDEKLMEVNTADDGDNDASCETSEESDDMEALGLCSPDGAFGLSGTADRTMCLLVGLLRGVLFWRCCSSREDEGSATPIAGPSTSGMVVARDRFGCEAARSDGLGLRDDQISLLILQPLTQYSLPLNGTGVNTWACHVLVLVLKQRQSLHHHLLYSQLLTSEFDDTVTCLLKALQPTCVYEAYVDFLEQLTPFSRLFACLASTCEDVRVRIGELSMIRALIQMFVTHPSLTTSVSIASLNLTLAVCQLLHGLSRSIALIHTVFSDVSIINCLIELATRLLPLVNSDARYAEITLAATSTLVNLQLCQLPELDESRLKSIGVFHSLLNVVDSENGLSLRLNGVWGLSSAAAMAAIPQISTRSETIECLDASHMIPKVVAMCNEILSRSGDCEMGSKSVQVENKMIYETSGSVLNSKPSYARTERYFIQKALLLLRNVFCLKEVRVSEYSDGVYVLLAKVFSSNQSRNANYEAMMILANLLTNADARSQFWLQTELIEALAAAITTKSELPLLCGAILVIVNILDVPELLATSVGGDSPGELFTQILSLLILDESRNYCSSYKPPSTTSPPSWCRHSSFSSSSRSHRRPIITNTAILIPPQQSPEHKETIESFEVEPQEKTLLRLISAFLYLFQTYSNSNSTSSTHTVESSMAKQMFKEVWDWQCQCGRGSGAESEDEQQPSGSQNRCKRFATATASTPSAPHYHPVGACGSPMRFLHRQEEAKNILETCLSDPGSGLKAFLTALLKEINRNDEDKDEGERMSRSPLWRSEKEEGPETAAVSGGEFEDN